MGRRATTSDSRVGARRTLSHVSGHAELQPASCWQTRIMPSSFLHRLWSASGSTTPSNESGRCDVCIGSASVCVHSVPTANSVPTAEMCFPLRRPFRQQTGGSGVILAHHRFVAACACSGNQLHAGQPDHLSRRHLMVILLKPSPLRHHIFLHE